MTVDQIMVVFTCIECGDTNEVSVGEIIDMGNPTCQHCGGDMEASSEVSFFSLNDEDLANRVLDLL